MQHPRTWKNSLNSRLQLRRGSRGWTLQIGSYELTRSPGKINLDKVETRYWKNGPLGYYWTGETTTTTNTGGTDNIAYYTFVQSYRTNKAQVKWR